jgi:hypothetical protein
MQSIRRSQGQQQVPCNCASGTYQHAAMAAEAAGACGCSVLQRLQLYTGVNTHDPKFSSHPHPHTPPASVRALSGHPVRQGKNSLDLVVLQVGVCVGVWGGGERSEGGRCRQRAGSACAQGPMQLVALLSMQVIFFFLGSYTWAQSPKLNWHCPPGEKQGTRPQSVQEVPSGGA